MTEKSLEQLVMEAIDQCLHTRCKRCEYGGDISARRENRSCQGRLIADHLRKNGVVVREKGEWVHCNGKSNLWYCSKCGEKIKYNPTRRTYNIEKKRVDEVNKLCRNCGADMRKGENDG